MKYPYLVVIVKRNGQLYETAPRRVDAPDAESAIKAAFTEPPSGREADTALVWRLAEPVELAHVPIEPHTPTWGPLRYHSGPSQEPGERV